MSTEEDTELRDLVIESLEKKGILGKIKAELRATVFLALEETALEKCKISLKNEALHKFMQTKEGITTVSFVRDFLQHFNLDYTLSVFDPEVSSYENKLLSKTEMENFLNIQSYVDEKCPLMSFLVRNQANHLSQDEKVKEHDSATSIPNEAASVILQPRNEETFITKKNHTDFQETKPKTDLFISDDDFFDDPILSNQKEPLLFSFLGKTVDTLQEKSGKESNLADDSSITFRDKVITHVNVEQQNKLTEGVEELPRTKLFHSNSTETFVNKSNSELSSLKDLPFLNNFATKRQGSEDYEDDFQSSLSRSGKSAVKTKGDGDDTEGSIAEDIDEDISGAALDLLNSTSSLGDDLTSDHTISQLSGEGTYDYIEKLK